MKKKLRSAFLLESLEPRLLFSADMAPVPVDGGIAGAENGSDLEISLRPDSGGMQASDTAKQERREVVFVDEAIDDADQLIADLESQLEKGRQFDVVALDSDHDGIAQISAYLRQHQDVAAVHIISHGADGEVTLGNSRLNATTLDGYAEAIEGWQRALSSNADLLFYGCNLAAGDDGQELVNSLTLLTGADVAASNDVTGSAQLGGDWVLEYGKGEIETTVAVNPETQQNWNGVLATFIVNTTADTIDVNLGDGSAEDAAGNTSLRAAIMEANALGGTNTINFDIPLDDLKHYYFKDDGSGNSLSLVAVTDLNDASIADFDPDYPGTPYSWFSIKPTSILPAITDPVIIDATTQPGYAGKPIIELDGTDVSGSDSNGLTIQGGNSTVRGLVINRFQGTLADALEIEINGGNTIAGNYIGTDVTGTQQKGNRWGINLKSVDNMVGGTNAADRNVISGNINEGFYIYTATASGNFLSGNYIGVDATGSAPLGNGSHGVYITSSASNTTIVGNVISGNTGHGIAIDKDDGGNIIEGNLIGTDVDGLVDLGNTLNGVDINDSANNRIGGKTPGAGNLISGNDDWGIHLDRGGATGNNIFGNLIGTDAKGTGGIGNLSGGVKVKGSATDNLIGGHFPGEGNIIAFNVGEGVNISSGTNRIRTNIIFDNGGATFDITLTGGNTNADMPSVSGAISGGGTTDVTVSLSGADANQSYRVDLFSNPTNEAEGQVYLGTVVLTTDGSGNASQLFTLNNEVPNGHYITATASNAISGTSAFCTRTIVPGPLSTNTAPLLDPTADLVLNEVNEDEGPPSGVVGTLISDLVDLNPPAGGNDNVSDPDIGAIPGIAIISAETDNGAWYYSTDNGTNWSSLGAVAIDSARLLAADGSTRIYFEPNPGFSGTVSSAIYFRAWDQTTGTNGNLADTTAHGGTAAFSLLFDSAAISVNTVNSAPTGSVTIDNTTPAQGDVLTASNTLADADGLSGPISYQWQRGGVDIGGATGATYTTVQADVGAVITVVASYTDDLGFDESVSSVGTAAVINVNDLGTVTIDNLTPAQGDTLTAGVSDPDGASGAIAYQWKRDGADIAAATGASYTTTQADVGAVITVTAIYTDDLSSAESLTSAPTAAVTNVNDPGTVTIDNLTPAQGDTLTAGVSDPDGATGAIAYQWKRDGADIAAATGASYTTTQADVGAVITVTAIYTDDLSSAESLTSAPTAAVTNVNDPGTVTIDNLTPAQGDTLTAGVSDPDGATGAIAYQWKRDGADIAAATGASYTTTQADVGAVITVTAIYTDDLSSAESLTSAPTAAVTNVNDPGTVTIDNLTPAQGDTLTAGVSDPDGATGAIAYQWKRNGADIAAATGASYTTTQADVGAVITVTAIYTDDLSSAESLTSAPTAAVTNVNDPGTVTIDNLTPAQGDTLTAGVSDPDGATGAIAYQWKRDGVAIGGATAATYNTVQADVGAVITVTADYTDDLLTVESLTSAGTAAVTNVNDLGSVTIDNTTPAEGDMLTASVTDPDGATGVIAYQWYRDGIAIGGANSNTYITAQADVGAVITVTADYTDDLSTVESLTSAPTLAVANINDAGTVTIDNTTPTQGDTLTAGVTDADGASGAINYQWFSDGIAIGGATGKTYATTQADVGTIIAVTAVYADDLGTAESLTSAGTAPVMNVNEIPVAVNDNLNATEDQSITFTSVTDLLGNDSDIDGDTLTISGFTQPANGMLADNADGTFTYTPVANFNGTDSFTYTINDGNGGTASGTAIIVVAPVGDIPQVTNVSTDAEVQSGLIFINRNASDGAEISHFKISGITNGALYLADGVTRIDNGDYITVARGLAGLRFTPTAGSVADGSFNVESSEDGVSVAPQSGIATSMITVMTPAPAPPPSEPQQGLLLSEPEIILNEELEQEETEDEEDPADETDVQADADNIIPVETPQPSKTPGMTKPSIKPGIASFRPGDMDSGNTDDGHDRGTLLLPQTLKILIEAKNLGELKAALGKVDIATLSPNTYELMRNSLDAIKDEIGKEILLDRAVLGSAIATSVGLSAGYVVWMLKGGSLLASLLSSLPAWQLADPLAILVGKKEDDDDEDNESLETIIEEGSGQDKDKDKDKDKKTKASELNNIKKESAKR